MLCVKFLGRGGEGVVKAAEILARSVFIEGKHVQFIPFFGLERRGAPVTAYVKIDEKPIRVSGFPERFDFLVALNPLLLGEDAVKGLREGGLIVANMHEGIRGPSLERFRVATLDATRIALSEGLTIAGSPIINTMILGGLIEASKIVGFESVKHVIEEEWSGRVREINLKALMLGKTNLRRLW